MSAACPACGDGRTFTFLVRRGVPVHQNVLLAGPEAARAIGRADLEMRCCEGCGFAFNRAFDPSKVDYSGAYDSTRTFSPLFDAYLDDLAGRLVGGHGVRGRRFLEIGCGEGTFLRKLLALDPSGTAVGFDPGHAGPATELEGRLCFVPREFPSRSNELADAVVCRHVIEHTPDPLSLARAVYDALAPGGRALFETPCLTWILENEVVWDFFYEHCSLFTASSLRTLLGRAGFAVGRVRHVFDGQYLLVEARRDGMGVAPDPGGVPEAARRFGRREPARLGRWRRRLADLAGKGPTALWGAAAKGVTFANLADPEGRLIDCLIDVNRHKQGRFVPGTGHPVVAPDAIPGRRLRAAVLMNPVYRPEIGRLVSDRGLALRLVSFS